MKKTHPSEPSVPVLWLDVEVPAKVDYQALISTLAHFASHSRVLLKLNLFMVLKCFYDSLPALV
jgi:hypothetical protein